MQRKIKHPWSERNTFFLKSSLQRTFLHALQTKIFFPDLLFCPPSSYIFFFAKKCLSCRYCKHWMGGGGEGRGGGVQKNGTLVMACELVKFRISSSLPPSFLLLLLLFLAESLSGEESGSPDKRCDGDKTVSEWWNAAHSPTLIFQQSSSASSTYFDTN